MFGLGLCLLIISHSFMISVMFIAPEYECKVSMAVAVFGFQSCIDKYAKMTYSRPNIIGD